MKVIVTKDKKDKNPGYWIYPIIDGYCKVMINLPNSSHPIYRTPLNNISITDMMRQIKLWDEIIIKEYESENLEQEILKWKLRVFL